MLKFLGLFLLLFFCLNTGFSQLINEENKYQLSDKILQSSTNKSDFSIPDLRDIKDFNFKRRRYANFMSYLEIGAGGGGNGTEFYSFYNFEFMLESKSDHMFTARVGGGPVFIPDEDSQDGKKLVMALTVPATLNFVIGHLNHFEIGFGVHYSEKLSLYPAGNIGFRHQPARGGLMYRISLTPHFPREAAFGDDPDTVIKVWAGFGLGFCW